MDGCRFKQLLGESMLEPITDQDEITSIKTALQIVRDYAIKQARETTDSLEAQGYYEDANTITRVIKTLRSI
jgi:hypothetical protein